MAEELLESYEKNYLNIQNMSIDYAIKNEYPIISLFTPLNAKEAYTVLNKIVYDKRLINFDLCCFLTLLVDAVSCSISNVSIEFGNEPDIYKLLKTILYVLQKQFYSNEIDAKIFENIMNIVKRSENRMNQSVFATIMGQIINTFDHNFRAGDLKFFKEKPDSVDIFKENVCVSSVVTERPKDISRYFMKRDKFTQDRDKILSDQNANKNKKMIGQNELQMTVDQNENSKHEMAVDQTDIINNKENLEKISANPNELLPLMSKIFDKNDLVQPNKVPTVKMKRNAFDILMRKKI